VDRERCAAYHARMQIKKGQKLPEFRLATIGGLSTSSREFLRKPTLYIGWASWDSSRELLGAVEKFHQKYAAEVRVVTIAFEAWNIEHCNRYLKLAGFTHLALADCVFNLSRVWGVKQVPFAVLADAEGYAQIVDVPGEELWPKVLAALKKKGEHKDVKPAKRKGIEHPKVEILVQEGMNYLTRNRVEDALGFWGQALKLDPENQIIKRQMDVLRTPDKFYTK